jgi:ABC-type cobalamin/Fe3+-siderophores transport system ATPase subunit
MEEFNIQFNIPTTNNGMFNINLTEGNALFVLGANGTGKSSLMYTLFAHNSGHAKRILAHRRTWFNNNTIDISPSQKKSSEQNIKNTDSQSYSRWRDDYAEHRSSISIFELINSENIRARKIAGAVDKDELQIARTLSNDQSPLQAINELLAISNIPISIRLGKDDELLASKKGSAPYSIAELSDGERNALLICADVLTTEPNHLIILDEPERHLHRSIISPLLTSLIQKRKDCIFVISTHDVQLPIDHSKANVLLVRDCQWEGKNIKSWDADLVSNTDDIPSSIKEEILGSKRNILFVEGNETSLDKQIYQLIFPTLTVISLGSCKEVERAVEGIKETDSLHWINAYGLVDKDDRINDEIQHLQTKGIAALESYSVESLYYNTEVIKFVAERYAKITGDDSEQLYTNTTSGIIGNIVPHKKRLCSRLCEKKIRSKIMSKLPKHQDILEKEELSLDFDLKTYLENEEAVFDKLIEDQNLDGLISRYPIRETPVINGIVSSFGIRRDTYESMVRQLIIDSDHVKNFYRRLLKDLTDLIE